LAGGLEDPDGVDLVAEEIEPERIFGAAGEDIDDAAALGEFAGFHHRVRTDVAVAR